MSGWEGVAGGEVVDMCAGVCVWGQEEMGEKRGGEVEGGEEMEEEEKRMRGEEGRRIQGDIITGHTSSKG